MTINSKFKNLIAVALLSGFSSFAAAGAEENNSLAQGATADQAQHGFWNNPNVNYISVEFKVDDNDLSFWDVPHLEGAFIDTAPADRNDGLAVGELGVDGGNKEMIVHLAEEFASGLYADDRNGDYDALLISHKGKLLFESYFSRGRINLSHPQASATKSYTSMALGRAIQLGYLTMADLDKPLVSFLKDLDPEKFVEGAETITLHQALTMQSGIRISDEQREKLEENPEFLKGQGHVQATFENSAPITSESQVFKYQGDPMLVMQVIDAVVPGTAEDFVKNELFDKMGIETYSWQTDVRNGLPMGGSRASITSRAMLKVGTLAMNQGKWDGEQLIPEAYITKAIHRNVRIGEDDIFFTGENVSNPGYGYYWWQADMKVGNKNYFTTSVQGGGGQYVILIDELDLIVVVNAHKGDDTTMQLTAERILPAFAQ